MQPDNDDAHIESNQMDIEKHSDAPTTLRIITSQLCIDSESTCTRVTGERDSSPDSDIPLWRKKGLEEWTMTYFTRPRYFEYVRRGYNEPSSNKDDTHFVHNLLFEAEQLSAMQYFLNYDESHMIFYCKLGNKICGHKGIIHGGLSATLIDNALGAFASMILHGPVATKSLTILYKRPLFANESIIITIEQLLQGTKEITVQAVIYGSDQKERVKGTGVFVAIGNRWKNLVNTKA